MNENLDRNFLKDVLCLHVKLGIAGVSLIT
jgi:hypothetical protein